MAADIKTLSTGTSAGSNFFSSAFDTTKFRYGSVQAHWAGFNNTNATMIMQGSDDVDMGYNDIGGSSGGIVCTSTANTQIWEIKEFTTRYVRLSHTANDVTTGVVSVVAYGKYFL